MSEISETYSESSILTDHILHGHSYGTAIAIEYAKRHPTSALVLHAGGDHHFTPTWEKPLLRLVHVDETV